MAREKFTAFTAWLHWCFRAGNSIKAHSHDYAHLSYFALVFVEGHGFYRYFAAILAVMTLKSARRGHH